MSPDPSTSGEYEDARDTPTKPLRVIYCPTGGCTACQLVTPEETE